MEIHEHLLRVTSPTWYGQRKIPGTEVQKLTTERSGKVCFRRSEEYRDFKKHKYMKAQWDEGSEIILGLITFGTGDDNWQGKGTKQWKASE